MSSLMCVLETELESSGRTSSHLPRLWNISVINREENIYFQFKNTFQSFFLPVCLYMCTNTYICVCVWKSCVWVPVEPTTQKCRISLELQVIMSSPTQTLSLEPCESNSSPTSWLQSHCYSPRLILKSSIILLGNRLRRNYVYVFFHNKFKLFNTIMILLYLKCMGIFPTLQKHIRSYVKKRHTHFLFALESTYTEWLHI